MAAITLVGTLRDGLNTGIDGTLTIKLDAPVIDTTTTPDTVFLSKPVSYKITAGALATAQRINDDGSFATGAPIVLQSTVSQTYTFSFTYDKSTREFYLDGIIYLGDWNQVTTGTTPPQGFYSGAVYNAATSRLLTVYQRKTPTDLFPPFSAKIPASPATIEFAALTDSGINQENIDTSMLEIARLVTTTFSSTLAASVFIPAGNYSAATSYAKNSVVYDPTTKKTYWKISTNTSAGLAVTDTNHWQVLLDAPTGASQTITLIDTTPAVGTWDNNILQAPTANIFWDTLQTLRTIADSYTKTQTDSAITTALTAYTPPAPTSVPDQASSDSSNKPANTRFVQSVRKKLVLEAARDGNQAGIVNGSVNIIWNSPVIDTAAGLNSTSGSYTIPSTGRYEILPICLIQFGGNTLTVTQRLFLRIGGVDSLFFDSISISSPGSTATFILGGKPRERTLTAGQVITIGWSTSEGSSPTLLGDSGVATQINTNRLFVWRLD